MSNPKFQGLRTEFLNHESVSIANDTLAVIDRSDRGEDKKDKKAGVACAVRVFDSATGKQLGEPITHNLEITDLALSHAGNERKLVCALSSPSPLAAAQRAPCEILHLSRVGWDHGGSIKAQSCGTQNSDERRCGGRGSRGKHLRSPPPNQGDGGRMRV